MSAPRTAYLNARLLDPESGLDGPGALLTEGAEIADLGAALFADGVPEGIAVVDCEGHCLAPGLIDMHVYLREPGAEHKETLATGSQAAAAGGVTTMICMPNTSPVIDDIALVDFIARRARDTAIVNVHPMAALTKGLKGKEMTEMGLLAEAGAVAFTDGHLAIADAQVMRRALAYASTFDLLVVHYVEEPSLGAEGCVTEGEVATRLGLPSVPAAAEPIMVERDVRLVELTGARYHAAHISTAAALEVVRRAKACGLPITCGVAPHNFALNESAIGDYRTFAKTSPPLRVEADRRAMVEGLDDGTIDVVSTGHAPQDQEGKRLPFAQAAYGIVGLETLLPLSLELYHGGHLELLDVLAAMTARPARLLRLGCGVLKAGAPADLVIFDLEAPWRIDAEAFRSKSKNSPFDERPVQGRALRTVVGGRTVYRLDGA
ncbi:MAG: dihydroorotase [Alphaproteobacteria bacterium]